MLTEAEVEEIEVMAPYVALHYVPGMCNAKNPTGSPENVLNSIYHLRLIREDSKKVADTALSKWELHLDWISGELLVFAMFN